MYVTRVNDDAGAVLYWAWGSGPGSGWRRITSRPTLTTFLQARGWCIDLVTGNTGMTSGDSITPVTPAQLAELLGTEIR